MVASCSGPREGADCRRARFVQEGVGMSVIKPRTRGKCLVKFGTRLDQENQETLYAYATFLGESTEYVLNQLIDIVLARDKEFVAWRAEHPQSCVPRPVGRSRGDARHAERTVGPSLGSTIPLSIS
jgi:hypothetical protein